MKVKVLQAEDAKFRRFAWWSDWVDIAVFDYERTPFLLQMQVSRTNKKRFNATRISGKFVYRQTTCAEIGDLTQMHNRHTSDN